MKVRNLSLLATRFLFRHSFNRLPH